MAAGGRAQDEGEGSDGNFETVQTQREWTEPGAHKTDGKEDGGQEGKRVGFVVESSDRVVRVLDNDVVDAVVGMSK